LGRLEQMRIIFTVDREARRVDIVEIGPRGQIYRGL
jgi:mRNA-degrading endonuclease RelE of RelBE toxin-antitoxin system